MSSIRNSRIIFNRPELDRQFKADGYVIIPDFLSLSEVEDLRQFYQENPSENQEGFHTTIHSKNYEYRKSVTEEINKRFSRKSSVLLNKYNPIFSCFTVKEPDTNSGFDLHLDWSMVDERSFSSITIWTPLLDITDENGYLWVLNGSHNFNYTIRGGPGLYLWSNEKPDKKTSSYPLKKIKLKRGEALIYDHRTFHGSPPNLSSEVRVAINFTAVPEEAKCLHYQFRENGFVDVFESPVDFYHSHILNTEPTGLKLIERIEIGGTFLYQEDVDSLSDKNYHNV